MHRRPLQLIGGSQHPSRPGAAIPSEALADPVAAMTFAAGWRPFLDERGLPMVWPGVESSRVLSLAGEEAEGEVRLLWAASHGENLKKTTIRNALALLRALAFRSGERYTLHVRCGVDGDGSILCDLDGRRVMCTQSGGWVIADAPPRFFRRFSHQRPLPIPVPGGDVREVLRFVNLPEDDELLIPHLVASFIPTIEVPLYEAVGLQGSGKTSFFLFLRRMLDPGMPEIRTAIGHGGARHREFALFAHQRRLIILDNLSSLDDAVSNDFCGVITLGGGWSERALYSNDITTACSYLRVVALGGITPVIERPDLASRAICYRFASIPDSRRREQTVFWREFEAARPRLLGALFTVLAKAREVEPTLKLSDLPRMTDFARIGAAVTLVLGGNPERFIQAYEANRNVRHRAVVEGFAVGEALLFFLRDRKKWQGPAAGLLGLLDQAAERHGIRKDKHWPRSPSWLSRRLHELEENLKGLGILVEEDPRSAAERTISITITPLKGEK